MAIGARRLLVTTLLMAWVFGVPHGVRAASGNLAEDSIALSQDGHVAPGAFAVGAQYALVASATTTDFACTEDQGCSSKAQNCGPRSPPRPVDAIVTAATCDLPCTAVVADEHTLMLSASAAAQSNLSVTMQKTDGWGEIRSSFAITFDVPTKIAVTRSDSALQGAGSAFLVGQTADWCAVSEDSAGNELGDGLAASASGGAVTDPSTTGCTTIRAVSVGSAAIQFVDASVSREVAVQVVDPTDVASLDLAAVPAAVANDTSIDDDLIGGLETLGPSTVILPDHGECSLRVAPRFRVPSGATGVAPGNIVTVTPTSALEVSASAITGSPYAFFIVRGGAPDIVTLSAKLGGATTTTSIDVSACPR